MSIQKIADGLRRVRRPARRLEPQKRLAWTWKAPLGRTAWQANMTVLIVEDNEGVRRLLRSVVAGIAAAVWDCCDGADALEAYAAYRPDIVLMDIRMPGMDGLAATRQILCFHPLAKIVIVTDYDDDALRSAAQDAGACGYALKLNLLGLAPLIRSVAGI